MKRLTIIVGAGGTGSYLIPNILRQYNDNFIDNKVIVLDGDFLEERNLLRQGFFKSVINNSKSEAMYKMHGKNYYGFLETKTAFLNHADELVNMVEEQKIDFEQIVLISCVDNNMARLRLFVAQQMLKTAYPEKEILFADSGNEEWFGQTILSYMRKEDKPFINFTKNEFSLIEENIPDTIDTVFSYLGEEWTTKLTKGDHELSCDIVVESAPQNIATNMMASNVLLFTINRLFNQNKIENVYFDCKLNVTNVKEKEEKEVLIRFLNDLILYLNSEEVNTVLSETFIQNNSNVEEGIYVRKPIVIEKQEDVEEVTVVNFEELKAIMRADRNNKKQAQATEQRVDNPVKKEIKTDIDLILPFDEEVKEEKPKNNFLENLHLELNNSQKEKSTRKPKNIASIIEELKLDL